MAANTSRLLPVSADSSSSNDDDDDDDTAVPMFLQLVISSEMIQHSRIKVRTSPLASRESSSGTVSVCLSGPLSAPRDARRTDDLQVNETALNHHHLKLQEVLKTFLQ